LSASFGTVLSDTDAKAGGIAKTLNQRVNAGSWSEQLGPSDHRREGAPVHVTRPRATH